MEELINKIEYLKEATIESEITNGWSEDTKYLVNHSGVRLLVRIRKTSFENYQRKVELTVKLSQVSTMLPNLIHYEYLDGHQVLILNWINGKPLYQEKNAYTEDELYQLGFKAGQCLRKIHEIDAPSFEMKWSTRYQKKIERVLRDYQASDYSFDGEDQLINYITNNRDLVKKCTSKLQHGDFHMGNMIVDHQKLYVIDLDRCDYGCPIEEYNRFYFTSMASIHFAKGQLDGYEVDDTFFKLMKLYIAVNTISCFIWAEKFGQKEIDTTYECAKYVIEQYNNFESLKPNWYKNC